MATFRRLPIQSLYLILCVLGTVLPCSQLFPFLAQHGFNLPLLIEQLFANRISGFFALDVIVSSVVLWAFVLIEGRRQQMKHLWIYLLCNLALGVSLALPLFLYMRERQTAQRQEIKQAVSQKV
ncbi:MAG: hypothetical protein V7641_4902 [Blastocatellia bacterium]